MKPRTVWIVALAACFLGLSAPAQHDLSNLEIFQKDPPVAFFFRQSETQAASGETSYEQWEKNFVPLNGIMGKALDEEVPHGKAKDFFNRYKQTHPEKAALLHYNGNGRDPRFETKPFFAGHWLYYNGCKITQNAPAENGQSVLHVEDTSLFKTNMGRFQNKNEDLGVCLIGADGKLDWSHAEQVELVSLNAEKRTLTVKRGSFGTTPIACPAGKSYVAAHVTRGPWGEGANLLWLYNHATCCPKDTQGRTCNDVALADLKRWLTDGGPLASFDGLEFDAAPFRKGPEEISRERAIDIDADGKADNGWVNGVNVFGIGIHEYHARLREILGDNRLIMADGGTPYSQRSFDVLNGIESEGWPVLSDYEIVDWSGGINRQFYWRDNARKPVLNYINHKFREKGDKAGHETPTRISRLVLAVAMLTDSAVTYSSVPPAQEGRGFPIWDELIMGAENKPNWLGKPKGETMRLGLNTPDLLQGAGAAVTPEFVKRWASADSTIAAAEGGKALKIAGKSPKQREMTATFTNFAIPKGELLVYCTVQGEPWTGYPAATPRLVWVSCEGAGQLITEDLPRAGAAVRGQAEAPLEQQQKTGANIEYRSRLLIGKEGHECYAVHPPQNHAQGPGYIYWERDVVVPQAPCSLSFLTGLNDTKGNSDGVAFSVEVRTGGETKKVFDFLEKKMEWKAQSVELAPWAGQRVTLRFVADSGPNDSSTADHGAWGDVSLGAKDSGPFRRSNLTPGQIMTFAGHNPFLSCFYFRDLGPTTVNLTFRIEGCEPVTISGFTIHNSPDAMAREFAHGVVLANPSAHNYEFDLVKLFPGANLRRLKGTAKQDPQANNGQPVGETITLADREGIFLVKQ